MSWSNFNPNWKEERTTVRATCPDCGDIATTAEKVVLRLPEGQPTGSGEYRFVCPQCEKIVLKPASPAIVQLLTQSGIKTEYYEPPIELLERPLDAPPISLDDLIDLHEAIERWENG